MKITITIFAQLLHTPFHCWVLFPSKFRKNQCEYVYFSLRNGNGDWDNENTDSINDGMRKKGEL